MKEIHKPGFWCGRTGFNPLYKASCVILTLESVALLERRIGIALDGEVPQDHLLQ